MYNIINFETTRYKLTAPGNIIPWIHNYKLLKPVSILRLNFLPKDYKSMQNC